MQEFFVLFHREVSQQIKEAQTVYLNAEDKALAHVTEDMRLGKIVLCHSAEIFQPGHPKTPLARGAEHDGCQLD